MRLQTKSYLLTWILLTTQHRRCDGIPEPAQALSISDMQEDPEHTRHARLAPLYAPAGHSGSLSQYGHGLTGIHHSHGGIITAHQGLEGHTGPVLHYGHDPGNVCVRGFHNGILGGHHSCLLLHGAGQVSGGNKFDPPFKDVINEHPYRNQISGPALHRLPVDQKLSAPLFHTNGFYEPELRYSVTGINSHPTIREWHYPDVGDHAMGLKGTHRMGWGVYYGASTPQQYSKGFSGSHTGLPSALQKMNNGHGTAGLNSYNLAGGPNGFHRIGVKEGKTGGLPVRGISGYYGQTVGQGAMVTPVMGIHNYASVIHDILPSGHENTMGGYHPVVTKGYQGLSNMYNFGLHNDMHRGTGKYGASGYHGNKYHSGGYYGMNGYSQGEYDGRYHEGGYNENKYHPVGHHGVNGHHGTSGYLESGSHRSMTAKRHESFESGGHLQEPILLRTGSQLGEKLKADQNIMVSVFKGETYQERQGNMPYFGKESSDHRTLTPSTDGKRYTSESLEIVKGDINYKQEFSEGMENKSQNMEEISGNYIKKSDYMSSKTKQNINTRTDNNFLYETHTPMSVHPTVLSDNPYARGLHVDLLHGGTPTVEVDSNDQALEATGLTEGQSGSPAKHKTEGGSWHWHPGNPNILQPQQNLQKPESLLSSFNGKLVERLGLQGQEFTDTIAGKSWTGYDWCKYGNSGVDSGYRLVPFIYQPWYYFYGQDYMTPYLSSYWL